MSTPSCRPDDSLWPPYWPHVPATLPPRFARGDRVRTRMGRATVLRDLVYALDGERCYLVRHTWADGDPEFGHVFREGDIELLMAAPMTEPEGDLDGPTPPGVASAVQLALF